jgi:hypothetical protein
LPVVVVFCTAQEIENFERAVQTEATLRPSSAAMNTVDGLGLLQYIADKCSTSSSVHAAAKFPGPACILRLQQLVEFPAHAIQRHAVRGARRTLLGDQGEQFDVHVCLR